MQPISGRFVVLRHELPPASHRASHWDWMLADEGVLRTWAVEEWPEPGTTVGAVRLADHRPEYLDFEGEVSGGRGSVRRAGSGLYAGVREQGGAVWSVLLHGEPAATLTLTHRENDRWELSLLPLDE